MIEQPERPGGYIRNSDGTLTRAVPLGWQGPDNQVDFEVEWGYAKRWRARGYNRADELDDAVVEARTRLGLILAARRRVGWRTPVTFLWDAK